MILLSDSGSTKADWVLIDKGIVVDSFHTAGFNPYFHNEAFILKTLRENEKMVRYAPEVKRIHFFGAGCSSPERNGVIRGALKKFFSFAEIQVDHDVYASVLATCGDRPGVACILGTGSNSCYFDGKKIHPNNYGLGFIMGDEGGGSYLGKKLITQYLYKTLPDSIRIPFEAKYKMDKEIMVANVYNNPSANVWLASFAGFYSEHANDPWVNKTVRKGFEEFLELYVCDYPSAETLDIHFVGSIAYYFQELLRETAAAKSLRVGRIVHHPINGLAEYFISKEQDSNTTPPRP